ncbi:MAG: hypothetical protein ACKONH_08235, partial [Planctomycetia bacterium]
MAADPLADVVSGQYRKWAYPEPIVDLPGWLGGNWQWFDPSHAHRMFWPDRGYPADLQILVAGCGANQAAVVAHTIPGARVAVRLHHRVRGRQTPGQRPTVTLRSLAEVPLTGLS